MKNVIPLVYKGGWEELENIVTTDNAGTLVLPSPEGDIAATHITNDGKFIFATWAGPSSTSRRILRYPLNVPHDVESVQEADQNISVEVNGNEPFGIWLNRAGTRLYYLDITSGSLKLLQYNLTVKNDLTTAPATPTKTAILDNLVGTPVNFALSTDGTKIFITSNDNHVTQGTFSTGFEIDTLITGLRNNPINSVIDIAGNAVFQSSTDQFLFVGAEVIHAGFVIGGYNGTFNITVIVSPTRYEVGLSDLGSSPGNSNTLALKYFRPSSGVTPRGIAFKPEGDLMYIGDITNDEIQEYSVTPTFDILTNNPNLQNTLSITDPSSIQFRTNGAQFVKYDGTLGLERFEMPVEFPWTITRASKFIFSVGITGGPRAISWRPDGSRMYTVDKTSGDLHQYNIAGGTANNWNLNSIPATPSETVSLSSFDTDPEGMWWKPDGTVLFIAGNQTTTVYQLNATTPWDITSLSTTPDFTFTPNASEITVLRGIFIDPEGKRMYLVQGGPINGGVYQYDLNADYSLSVTPDFTGNKISDRNNSDDVFFRNDGKLIYIIENGGDNIVLDRLQIPWVTTDANATRISSANVSLDGRSPQGLFIRQNDGKRLYVSDAGKNEAHMYYMDSEFNNSLITNFGDELTDNTGANIIHDTTNAPADWFDTSFKQRVSITVNNLQVPTTQTNFPFLFNSTVTELIGNVQSLGQDIRFADENKKELSYEIQSFDDSTGEIIAWVKFPSISDGSKIFMYFDNPNATDNQNPPAVWSNGFLAVYHMIQSGNPTDSLGNFDTTLGLGVNSPNAAGQIGQAKSFTGTFLSSYLIPASLEFTGNNITVSAWATALFPTTSVGRSIIAERFGGNGTVKFAIGFNDSGVGQTFAGFFDTGFGWERANNPSAFDTAMHYWAGTYDGINLKYYLDSLLIATTPTTENLPMGSNGWNIGHRWDNETNANFAWGGIVDEVRVANVTRDSDWITTEHNNQVAPATFYAIGAVENID